MMLQQQSSVGSDVLQAEIAGQRRHDAIPAAQGYGVYFARHATDLLGPPDLVSARRPGREGDDLLRQRADGAFPVGQLKKSARPSPPLHERYGLAVR